MLRLPRAIGLLLAERRLVHEQVGSKGRLDHAVGGRSVACQHDLPARPGLAEHLLGSYDAAVGKRDGRARLQRPALGPERDAQGIGGGNVETPRPLVLDERVAEGVAPVADGEGPHLVPLAPKHRALGELDDGYLVAQATEDARQRAEQVIEAPWPVQRQRHLAATESKRLQHPGQAEEVVGVEVRQEDLVELDQADVRAQELSLRAFAAVEEQLLPTAPDERGGRSAASGRHRAGRAEEDDVEIHAASLGRRVLRQDEHLARDEHRSLELVPPLDLPDTLARIRVPARRDRPERVVRLHDVAALRPGGVGGTGESGPEKDAERDNDENASEHVFAMMHEHVFAVKSLRLKLRQKRIATIATKMTSVATTSVIVSARRRETSTCGSRRIMSARCPLAGVRETRWHAKPLFPKEGGGRRVSGARQSERAFRGLALVFVLSFVNLVGVIFTAAALGGVEPWTGWQFVGAFGVIEAASGLANVISPNIWRLPVAELQTNERTDVKLAASALLLPHWGGLARFGAGLVCLALVAWQDGLGPASAALVPFVLAIAWSILALSAILARAGVARPDLDVFQIVVRWGRREQEAAPVSIGASVFQFLLSIATIPAVKLLPPSVLYQPELGPSLDAMIVALVVSVALFAVVWVLWAGRIELHAPADQQREAEQHA